MKNYKEPRIDNSRALFITNCVIRNYLFGQKETYQFPESQKIKNVFVGYSNLMHMIPTDYHGGKAFFRQIRFDLRFLEGMTNENDKYLLDEIKSLHNHLEALLGTANHMFKKYNH